MKKTIATKVISLVVASAFLVNNFAYGLATMPLSAQPDKQVAAINMAKELVAAKRGECAINLEEMHIGEFIPSEPPRIEGVEILSDDSLSEQWRKGASFINLFKSALKNYGIPEDALSITEDYLLRDKPDMVTGELPIFKIMVLAGKKTLAFDKNFVAMFNDIAENDIRFRDNTQDGRSVALEILKHVLNKLTGNNAKEDEVSLGIWMWFLHAYAFKNLTRYDNNLLEERLNWVFEDKEAQGLKLDTEFQAAKDNKDLRHRAIQIALFVNFYFHSERAKHSRVAGGKSYDASKGGIAAAEAKGGKANLGTSKGRVPSRKHAFDVFTTLELPMSELDEPDNIHRFRADMPKPMDKSTRPANFTAGAQAAPARQSPQGEGGAENAQKMNLIRPETIFKIAKAYKDAPLVSERLIYLGNILAKMASGRYQIDEKEIDYAVSKIKIYGRQPTENLARQALIESIRNDIIEERQFTLSVAAMKKVLEELYLPSEERPWYRDPKGLDTLDPNKPFFSWIKSSEEVVLNPGRIAYMDVSGDKICGPDNVGIEIKNSDGSIKHVVGVFSNHGEIESWARYHYDRGLFGKGKKKIKWGHIDGHGDEMRSKNSRERKPEDWRRKTYLDMYVQNDESYGISSFLAGLADDGIIDPENWYFKSIVDSWDGYKRRKNGFWYRERPRFIGSQSLGSDIQYDLSPEHSILTDQTVYDMGLDVGDVDIDFLYYVDEPDEIAKALKKCVKAISRSKMIGLITSPGWVDQELAIIYVKIIIELLQPELDNDKIERYVRELYGRLQELSRKEQYKGKVISKDDPRPFFAHYRDITPRQKERDIKKMVETLTLPLNHEKLKLCDELPPEDEIELSFYYKHHVTMATWKDYSQETEKRELVSLLRALKNSDFAEMRQLEYNYSTMPATTEYMLLKRAEQLPEIPDERMSEVFKRLCPVDMAIARIVYSMLERPEENPDLVTDLGLLLGIMKSDNISSHPLGIKHSILSFFSTYSEIGGAFKYKFKCYKQQLLESNNWHNRLRKLILELPADQLWDPSTTEVGDLLEIDGGGEVISILRDPNGVEPDKPFTFSFMMGDQRAPELYAHALRNGKVFFEPSGKVYLPDIYPAYKPGTKIRHPNAGGLIIPPELGLSEWTLAVRNVRFTKARERIKKALAKYLTPVNQPAQPMGGVMSWDQLVEETLAANDMTALAQNVRLTDPSQLIALARFLALKHPQKYAELRKSLTEEEARLVDEANPKLLNPYDEIAQALADALKEEYGEQVPKGATIEAPDIKEHGDYSSNAAFLLAKKLRKSPKIIADEIAKNISAKKLKYICEAQNGHINFKLADAELFGNILKLEQGLSRSASLSVPEYAGQNINIEYVSANPTGPLHIGHGRWAVLGSCIANILRFSGAQVTEEFYINDAGTQIKNLIRSVDAVRNGQPIPEDGYHGGYVQELAAMDDSVAPADRLLAEQKDTLKTLQTRFHKFFSEKRLHAEDRKKIKEAVEELRRAGYVYEEKGATWFRSTAFGDDKDRVLIRENGEPTYFAADVAYHMDKVSRGYDLLINIWGADHHGYVARLTSAVKALKEGQKIEVILGQLVKLMKNGEPFVMSKRAGTSVTLKEVMDLIGVDATRYFLARSNADSEIKFDLDIVKEHSDKNPLYGVQYAHARVQGMLKKMQERGIAVNEAEVITALDEYERDLACKLLEFPEAVKIAALRKDPSKLTTYVEELAKTFHKFYDHCSILKGDQNEVRRRYWIAKTAGATIKQVLDLLGVSAPDRMDKTEEGRESVVETSPEPILRSTQSEAAAVEAKQPRDERGRYGETETGNPDFVFKVIATSKLCNMETFTISDVLSEFASRTAAVSRVTLQQDIYLKDDSLYKQGLLIIVNENTRRGKEPFEFELTPLGRARAAILAAKENINLAPEVYIKLANFSAGQLVEIARRVAYLRHGLDSRFKAGSRVARAREEGIKIEIRDQEEKFTYSLAQVLDYAVISRALRLIEASSKSAIAREGYHEPFILQMQVCLQELLREIKQDVAAEAGSAEPGAAAEKLFKRIGNDKDLNRLAIAGELTAEAVAANFYGMKPGTADRYLAILCIIGKFIRAFHADHNAYYYRYDDKYFSEQLTAQLAMQAAARNVTEKDQKEQKLTAEKVKGKIFVNGKEKVLLSAEKKKMGNGIKRLDEILNIIGIKKLYRVAICDGSTDTSGFRMLPINPAKDHPMGVFGVTSVDLNNWGLFITTRLSKAERTAAGRVLKPIELDKRFVQQTPGEPCLGYMPEVSKAFSQTRALELLDAAQLIYSDEDVQKMRPSITTADDWNKNVFNVNISINVQTGDKQIEHSVRILRVAVDRNWAYSREYYYSIDYLRNGEIVQGSPAIWERRGIDLQGELRGAAEKILEGLKGAIAQPAAAEVKQPRDERGRYGETETGNPEFVFYVIATSKLRDMESFTISDLRAEFASRNIAISRRTLQEDIYRKRDSLYNQKLIDISNANTGKGKPFEFVLTHLGKEKAAAMQAAAANAQTAEIREAFVNGNVSKLSDLIDDAIYALAVQNNVEPLKEMYRLIVMLTLSEPSLRLTAVEAFSGHLSYLRGLTGYIPQLANIADLMPQIAEHTSSLLTQPLPLLTAEERARMSKILSAAGARIADATVEDKQHSSTTVAEAKGNIGGTRTEPGAAREKISSVVPIEAMRSDVGPGAAMEELRDMREATAVMNRRFAADDRRPRGERRQKSPSHLKMPTRVEPVLNQEPAVEQDEPELEISETLSPAGIGGHAKVQASALEAILTGIMEFKVPVAFDVGPGSVRIDITELPRIWQMVNLLHTGRIEAFMSEATENELTGAVKRAFDNAKNGKSEDAVRRVRFLDAEDLIKVLESHKDLKTKKLIFAQGEPDRAEIRKALESRPDLFKNVRVFNFDYPQDYVNRGNEDKNVKTFYQLRAMIEAILLRLCDEDTPMTRLLLNSMLEGCVEDKAGDFINVATDDKDDNLKKIEDRILYSLQKTVSLAAKTAEAFEHLRLIIKEVMTML